MLLATAASNFSTSQLQKVVRAWSALCILTLKRASRYSGVQFFHFATSKSGPNPAVLVFHFSTSQLPKVVRTRQVFNILTLKCASRYSDVPFFDIVTPKSGPNLVCFVHSDLECASCYSGVQFFICPLNSYLRTRRFTEPTFRPSRPTNHCKNTAIRDFPNISRVWIFFLLTFAQLYLFSSDSTSLLAFSSSDSASLLCFFNCPYCRKLDF